MLEDGEVLHGTVTEAHIIQVALTPVFLLSGIALLLNVFSMRLARVADRVHAVSQSLRVAGEGDQAFLQRYLEHLLRRSHILDGAVALAAAGGIATCAAVILLFIDALRETAIVHFLLAIFGSALLCTAGALSAFLVEILIASRGIRDQARTVRDQCRSH